MGKTATPILHDKLYTLETALDETAMREVFAQMVTTHWGTDFELIGLRIEVMRRRNQRCVIRYITEMYDRREERRTEWRIVGKVYKAGRGESVFITMQDLWRNGLSRASTDGISMPEPIAFSSELCLLYQEEVPGEPIKHVLKKDIGNPKPMRLLARTLAKLHQTAIDAGEAYSIDDHLLRCHPRYPFLCLAYPELEPKIEYIIRKAKAFEAENSQIRFATVHGDFHLGQVHVEGEHAWLIDYDALCHADPAADVGNLMVFLKGKAKRYPEWRMQVEAFLDEYYAIMGAQVAERVPLYEALTHIRRACKCLRYQEKDWRRKVEKMIDQGVACIDALPTQASDAPYTTEKELLQNGTIELVG